MTTKQTTPNFQFLPFNPGQEVKLRFVKSRTGPGLRKLQLRSRRTRTRRRAKNPYCVTRRALARHWVYSPRPADFVQSTKRAGCPVCDMNVAKFARLLVVTPVRMRYADFHPEFPTRVW